MSLCDFEGLLDLSYVDDILSNCMMQIFVNFGNSSQSVQDRKLVSHFVWDQIEAFNDAGDLGDVIRENDATSEHY